MNEASRIFRELNANADIGVDHDGAVCMIEDVVDCPEDMRWYRMEYRATPDAKHCVAYCRHNPWGPTPNAGQDYTKVHVDQSGFICTGDRVNREMAKCPYDIKYTVGMARWWCVGFSFFMQHGRFPQPSDFE